MHYMIHLIMMGLFFSTCCTAMKQQSVETSLLEIPFITRASSILARTTHIPYMILAITVELTECGVQVGKRG